MSACRYAPDRGRVLTGHHNPDCADDTCRGCQPCEDDHCQVCTKEHAAVVCDTCLGAIRDDLRTIVELHGQLPAEAAHHASATIPGGAATVALGPWSPGHADVYDDPETWGLNLDNDWHPLLTLATWEDVWRDWYGTATDLRATIDRAADYLRDHLTDMARQTPRVDADAEEEWPPDLPQMAADLRQLRGRLEGVLRAGDRDDRAGVACFDCGGQLVRRMTPAGLADRWTCRRCRREYTDPEYRLAVRAKIERQAS